MDYEIRCANCGRKQTIAMGDNTNPVYICGCGAKTKMEFGKGFEEKEYQSRKEFAVYRPAKKVEPKDLPYGRVVEMEE